MVNQFDTKQNGSGIAVVEKPDTVSWDDIQRCLYGAHSENRRNGIVMTHYLRSGCEIADYVGKDGKCWVAMNRNNIVGVACLKVKYGTAFYNQGPSGYCCFDAVLSEYRGLGIFRELDQVREKYARDHSFKTIYWDTHIKNKSRINMGLKNGYRKVSLKRYGDHYSVMMAKWLDPCPYSSFYINKSFVLSCIRVCWQYTIRSVAGVNSK